ncbi:MAG: hypothetical protein KTR31_05195 [Myxococcales bacterium]|nr:hypothetical protein [Myxococcales bacterium]
MRNLTLLLALAIGCTGNDTTDKTSTGDTGATATSSTIEDVFTQNLLEDVDIVVVFDTNWDDASKAFKTAMDEIGYKTLLLADPNWQIGLMTSDVSNVSQRGFIRGIHTTVFPDQGTLDVVGNGSSLSKVREAIYVALTDRLRKGGGNEDFFRPDAHTYFMVITESRDRSEDEPISADAFANFIERADFTQSIRLGVITLPDNNTERYWTEVAQQLGGTVDTVGSWNRAVESRFFEAIDHRREFPLSELPASPPREIIVVERDRPRTKVIEVDYDYVASRNAIRFIGEVPTPGAQIRVTYEKSDEPVNETAGTE